RDRLRALRDRAARGGALLVHDIPNALLVDAPGAVSARDLRQSLRSVDAAVCIDLADPTRLVVGVPAVAASLPAAAVEVPDAAVLAHEPMTAYVRRRLPEAARDPLRRTAAAGAAGGVAGRGGEERGGRPGWRGGSPGPTSRPPGGRGVSSSRGGGGTRGLSPGGAGPGGPPPGGSPANLPGPPTRLDEPLYHSVYPL